MTTKRTMGLKTVCDRKNANKHQVKEDQTHKSLPLCTAII